MNGVVSRRLLQIQLETFDVTHVLRFAENKVLLSAELMPGIKRNGNGPVYLPTKIKRWTTNKDVFVHKKARDQWERRTTRRLITVTAENPIAARNFKRWLKKAMPPEVGLKISEQTFDGLDTYYNATPVMPVGWDPTKPLPDSVYNMPDGAKLSMDTAKKIRGDLGWYSRKQISARDVPEDPLVLGVVEENLTRMETMLYNLAEVATEDGTEALPDGAHQGALEGERRVAGREEILDEMEEEVEEREEGEDEGEYEEEYDMEEFGGEDEGEHEIDSVVKQAKQYSEQFNTESPVERPTFKDSRENERPLDDEELEIQEEYLKKAKEEEAAREGVPDFEFEGYNPAEEGNQRLINNGFGRDANGLGFSKIDQYVMKSAVGPKGESWESARARERKNWELRERQQSMDMATEHERKLARLMSTYESKGSKLRRIVESMGEAEEKSAQQKQPAKELPEFAGLDEIFKDKE